MRRILSSLFLVVTAGIFLFFGCSKEYMHLNPYDPLYNGPYKHTGQIIFDKTGYQGIGGTAVIKVVDPDLNGSSAVISVKSLADPTGIWLTLYKSAGNYTYTGTLKFTNNASTPYRNLFVTNHDSITALYIDITPSGTRTAQATFITNSPILTNKFVLFSDTWSEDVIWDSSAKMQLWQDTWAWDTKLITDTSISYEGSKSLKAVMTNTNTISHPNHKFWINLALQVWPNGNTTDLSSYSSGHLNFAIKSATLGNMIVYLQHGVGGTDGTHVALSGYGYSADDSWHFVSIPMSALDATASDFSQIWCFAVFMDNTGGDQVSGNYFNVDQIYLTDK
jgi:hypothetical protein